MPGQFVGVPHGPQKPKKKCTGGEHISHAAQEHLLCRGWFAGETDHLQAAQHHARRRSAKNGEKREVLQIEDRKCTRLNSSHSQISYAVFCLKKKKNKRK